MPNDLLANEELLTLDDLAKEAKESAATIWGKAFRAVTTYPKGLKTVTNGSSTYLVSPYYQGTHPPYAVAVLKNGLEMTKDASLYILPQGDFSKLITVMSVTMPDDPKGPLLRLDNNRGVSAEAFDAVLDGILAQVQKLKDADDKRKQKRRAKWEDARDGFLDFLGDAVSWLFTVAIAVGIIAAVIGVFWAAVWGITYASQGDLRYTLQWDKDHPSLSIKGARIDVGQEVTLPAGFDRMDPGVPRVPVIDPTHPRAFLIDSGTCSSDSNHKNIGGINGDNHLIAQTDAPANMVKVQVTKDATVFVCANDAEPKSGTVHYIVVVQQVPNGK